MERFRQASERQNKFKEDEDTGEKGKANALYTSYNGQPDPGFMQAKTMKHAFRALPKVKLKAPTVAALHTETVEPEMTEAEIFG